MKKRILAVFLAAALMCSFALSVSADNVQLNPSQIVYQDEDYTVVARMMTVEEGEKMWREMIAARGPDAIPIQEGPQSEITPFALKNYSKTGNFRVDGLSKTISLTAAATVNQTSSTMIGTLQSARIYANNTAEINTEIVYYTYEGTKLDGGRTYSIKYSRDFKQNHTTLFGNWTGYEYASGAIIYEIYASGGSEFQN